MFVPCLVAGDLVRLTVGLSRLNVWLLLTLVKILRDEVKDGVDALLTVVLAIALEGDVVLAEESFE